MSRPLLVAENEEISISIYPDEDAESPRERDNLGTMVCWHRRYNLGDKHSYGQPSDFLEVMSVQHGMSEERAIRTGMDDHLAYLQRKGVLILPLYLYDHSGITMSTRPFRCPWDSGQVGWIYVTPEKLREEYGKRLTRVVKERAERVLVGEVKVYDQYLRGDVYGFEITDKEGNHVDSCWGFFGSDPFDNGMSGHIDEKYHDLLRSLKAPDPDCLEV